MAQSYSARTLSSVNIASLAQGRDGQAVVIGVDVSKAELRLVPRWADGEFARPVRVRQPSEIGQGVGLLRELGRDRELIVAIEPTGRYGDVFRQACHRAGITVHRVSAKVSHDYAEVFDGVPSQHDGKDAALIAELAAIGKSRPWPWPEPDGWEQRLSVCAALGDAYQRQRIAWMNRIEAWLAAHWPEVQEHLWLTSATLPRILARYGSPRALAADPQAAVRLQQWGRGLLSPDRIEKILRSARETVGVEVMREEAMRVRRYAIEVLRARLRLRRYKSQMARLARAHPVTSRMAKAVGPATAGVLWLEAGDPGKYSLRPRVPEGAGAESGRALQRRLPGPAAHQQARLVAGAALAALRRDADCDGGTGQPLVRREDRARWRDQEEGADGDHAKAGPGPAPGRQGRRGVRTESPVRRPSPASAQSSNGGSGGQPPGGVGRTHRVR